MKTMCDASNSEVKSLQLQLRGANVETEIARKEAEVHRNLCCQLEERLARANVTSITQAPDLDNVTELYKQMRVTQNASEDKILKLLGDIASAHEHTAMMQTMNADLSKQLETLNIDAETEGARQQADLRAAAHVEAELRAQAAALSAALAKSDEQLQIVTKQIAQDDGERRIQQLQFELDEAKSKLLAAEHEVLEVREAARRHAQVNIEAERIKWSDEEVRCTEKVLAQLVSARQAIQQMHRLTAKQQDGSCEIDKCEVDLASLQEDVREYFLHLASKSCTSVNELRTQLMRSELRTEALQVQIVDVEDMRLQVCIFEILLEPCCRLSSNESLSFPCHFSDDIRSFFLLAMVFLLR